MRAVPVKGDLDAADTRESQALAVVAGAGAEGRPTAVSGVWGPAAEVVADGRCACRHRDSGGVDTTVSPGRVHARNPAGVARSREIAVALIGVADETGTERDNPRESGRHAVAVGIAGHEMIGE